MNKSIVCIVPFRNEEANMEIYLRNLRGVADEVYGFNDRSTDDSAKVFEQFGGKIIGRNDDLEIGWKNSSKMRQTLLEAAIESKHTHLMVVDLDEIVLEEDKYLAKEAIFDLEENDVMTVDWYNLHGSMKEYTLLGQKMNYRKIFARKISDKLKFSPEEYLHFPQIPVLKDDKYIHKNLPLIHYQACDLEKFTHEFHRLRFAGDFPVIYSISAPRRKNDLCHKNLRQPPRLQG